MPRTRLIYIGDTMTRNEPVSLRPGSKRCTVGIVARLTPLEDTTTKYTQTTVGSTKNKTLSCTLK